MEEAPAEEEPAVEEEEVYEEDTNPQAGEDEDWGGGWGGGQGWGWSSTSWNSWDRPWWKAERTPVTERTRRALGRSGGSPEGGSAR